MKPGRSYKFKDWSTKPGEEMFYLGYGRLSLQTMLREHVFRRNQTGHIFVPRLRTNTMYDNSNQILVYKSKNKTWIERSVYVKSLERVERELEYPAISVGNINHTDSYSNTIKIVFKK